MMRLVVLEAFCRDSPIRNLDLVAHPMLNPPVQIYLALFPKSTIQPQLPQSQVTATLGAF
jgi:hypothetical protein